MKRKDEGEEEEEERRERDGVEYLIGRSFFQKRSW